MRRGPRARRFIRPWHCNLYHRVTVRSLLYCVQYCIARAFVMSATTVTHPSALRRSSEVVRSYHLLEPFEKLQQRNANRENVEKGMIETCCGWIFDNKKYKRRGHTTSDSTTVQYNCRLVRLGARKWLGKINWCTTPPATEGPVLQYMQRQMKIFWQRSKAQNHTQVVQFIYCKVRREYVPVGAIICLTVIAQ